MHLDTIATMVDVDAMVMYPAVADTLVAWTVRAPYGVADDADTIDLAVSGPLPFVTAAAEAHGRTPAQVVLRWQVQLGAVPIPKAASPSRQAENLAIFDFELTDGEMAAITALGRADGRRFDGDPDTHEEM